MRFRIALLSALLTAIVLVPLLVQADQASLAVLLTCKGEVTVIKASSGESEVISKVKGYALEPGDMVYLETGGGGGYGAPEARELKAIQHDLDRGYVTPEGAERDYGVSINADGKASRK